MSINETGSGFVMTYWLNFVLKQYPDFETWLAKKT